MHARVRQLEQAFDTIARTRMAGLPTVHPALHVEAVAFAPHAAPDGEPGLLGVLVTPWCMNLVWLPRSTHADARTLRVGVAREHVLGGERYAFLGAFESLQDLGAFEACSLFSPMHDFADHAGAQAVAAEVLRVVRATHDDAPPAPSRRSFLLARRAA